MKAYTSTLGRKVGVFFDGEGFSEVENEVTQDTPHIFFESPSSQKSWHIGQKDKKVVREEATAGGYNDLEALKPVMEIILEGKPPIQAAEEAGMKPNTLTVKTGRLIKKAQRTVLQDSQEILCRLTEAQWRDINENGGMYAFRLPPNGRAEMLRFLGDEHFYLTYNRNGADAIEAAQTADGWTATEAKICDLMCDIGRKWTAWFAFVDHVNALPRKQRAAIMKDKASTEAAWTADEKAWGYANKKWNRVVCFNFGSPNITLRLPERNDGGPFEGEWLALARSGRRPQKPVTLAQQVA